MSILELYEAWKSNANDDPDLQEELLPLTADEIHERFFRELEFGTGGLRGEIGAGINRMNIYTVQQATQGLAVYVNRTGTSKTVAIAYDSRIKSDLFAKWAAQVLAANGITAYIYPRLTPTPSLSFAVRHLGCDAGICITASHNPAKYNGYKVYGADGGQITSAAAGEILSEISKVEIFEDVRIAGFEEALNSGKIKYIGEDVLDAYIAAVLNERVCETETPLKIVYTPLNGAGLECVTRTLQAAGYSDIAIVEEQRDPDGNFPTCPYPNPENKDAMRLGIKLCEDIGADLTLATDADCDRVGVAAKESGGYRLLNGDEVGLLLLEYICVMRKKLNKMPKLPVVVKTIVTTDLASRIADFYGVQVINVLTGFKFIGEQIGMLEQNGEKERYIFGFEESCGYLSGHYVRDKDAVNACLLICDMAAWYKSQGISLPQALEKLYDKFGFCANELDTFDFAGETGLASMQKYMEDLRKNPPAAISGHKVAVILDYLWSESNPNGISGLPSSDVVQLRIDDGSLITVRPSGTEPKLKIYYEVTGGDKEKVIKSMAAYREELGRMI